MFWSLSEPSSKHPRSIYLTYCRSSKLVKLVEHLKHTALLRTTIGNTTEEFRFWLEFDIIEYNRTSSCRCKLLNGIWDARFMCCKRPILHQVFCLCGVLSSLFRGEIVSIGYVWLFSPLKIKKISSWTGCDSFMTEITQTLFFWESDRSQL